MNRLAVEAGAVSLAQGFPDFPAAAELKDAAAAGSDQSPVRLPERLETLRAATDRLARLAAPA